MEDVRVVEELQGTKRVVNNGYDVGFTQKCPILNGLENVKKVLWYKLHNEQNLIKILGLIGNDSFLWGH